MKINEKSIIKFNIYMSFILLMVFVLMFVCVTVAYFTSTQKMEVTYTAGNVKISLSEAAVKKDDLGNWVEDKDKDRIFGDPEKAEISKDVTIYPGQTIWKDPTIKNIGDDAEWVAGKVTIVDGAGDLTQIMGYDGTSGAIDIKVLLSGGLVSEKATPVSWNGISNVRVGDRYAMVQVPNAEKGIYEFYFFVRDPVPKDGSVKLFEKIGFPAGWTNTEMDHLTELEINVKAYGVQTAGMESCFKAMTTAFPDHFKFN